jgi:thiol-disulfide isomerase/thioredoxin
VPDCINPDRRHFLGTAALTFAAAQLGMIGCTKAPANRSTADGSADPPGETELDSLANATAWINSPPLTAAGLRGKVVLVHVCTYTCINWLRTLPYVRAWVDKYADDGLVLIGAHAPEFEFEKDLANVHRALKELRVEYPIAVDNDFAIWRAFDNNYWPALFLVDASGRRRYHHFGEGKYDASERMIQKLLKERGAGDVSGKLVSVEGRGVEADADWGSLRSPENYLGYKRTENFASPDGPRVAQPRAYDVPDRLRLDQWALGGNWTIKQQAVAANEPNARIVSRFHARDLHLVMGPPARVTPVRFRVLIDGQPPGDAHGLDVDASGNGVATYQQMYQLIRQPKPIHDRQFEIQFLEPGIEAFSFTFG